MLSEFPPWWWLLTLFPHNGTEAALKGRIGRLRATPVPPGCGDPHPGPFPPQHRLPDSAGAHPRTPPSRPTGAPRLQPLLGHRAEEAIPKLVTPFRGCAHSGSKPGTALAESALAAHTFPSGLGEGFPLPPRRPPPPAAAQLPGGPALEPLRASRRVGGWRPPCAEILMARAEGVCGNVLAACTTPQPALEHTFTILSFVGKTVYSKNIYNLS